MASSRDCRILGLKLPARSPDWPSTRRGVLQQPWMSLLLLIERLARGRKTYLLLRTHAIASCGWSRKHQAAASAKRSQKHHYQAADNTFDSIKPHDRIPVSTATGARKSDTSTSIGVREVRVGSGWPELLANSGTD
jgi:hypothetical protein